MRKGHLAFLFCIALVIFHAWFVSQLSYNLLPEVNTKPEAFSLEKERENTRLQQVENIINYTFRFDEEILNLTGYRESQHLAWSIFDVSVDVNIPLRKNLKFSFSMYASQLNLTTDSAYVVLTLTDGVNVILVGYYLGYQPLEWQHLRYYYVSYEVGDMSNMWVKGTRNIWDDLVQYNLSVLRSFRIVKVTFGTSSYNPTPQFQNNRKMQALFNASKNSLFFETSTFMRLVPTSYQFPWNAVILITLDLFSIIFISKAFKTSYQK